MSSSLETIQGTNHVFLWYNFDFVLDVPDVHDKADKDDYLKLALYHEAVHISDHMSGTFSLMPLISTNSPTLETSIARTIWNMEWSAVTKEWALAQKIHKPYLVPCIYEATKNRNTPENFLEGFYTLQRTGNAAMVNRDLIPVFNECRKEGLTRIKILTP